MIDASSYIDAARFQSSAAADSRISSTAKRDSTTASGNFSRMLEENIHRDSPVERQRKKLMDACVDMESLFVGKMLKEMRNSVPKNEWLHGGQAEEIFEDMLYDEYSKSISKNSNLGIAAMLYRELSAKM